MTNPGKLKDPNAILYFQNKTLLTTQSYKDLSAYEHAINFTVAKIANEDLLKTVKMALQSSIQDGVSFDEFKKNLLPYLNAQGWGNFSDNKNKLNHRLKIIYDTNRRTAYAAGQWARIQATKDVLPYLKYMPSTAKTKRDEHKRFYGLIRPVEDPIWQKLQPPSGFGCKCWIKQLTRREAQKEGVSAPFTDDEIKDLPDGLVSFDRLQNLLQVAKDKHGGEFADNLKREVEKLLPAMVQTADNVATTADELPPPSEIEILSLFDVPVDIKAVRRIAFDPDDKKIKFAEAVPVVQLLSLFGGVARRLSNTQKQKGLQGDFIIKGGEYHGKTIDVMFSTDNGAYDPNKDISRFGGWDSLQIMGINKSLSSDKGFKQAIKQIELHLNKSDLVLCDFRWLGGQNQQKLLDYIRNHDLKDKIIIVGE